MSSPADPMVSTDWLADHLSAPDVRVVDASWFMPGQGRTGQAQYALGHIPGAVFFDIDAIADTGSDLPHMLPSSEVFAARVGHLGLGNGHRVVVYDSEGIATAAARVWWMMRVFGHEDVVVLDGGLPKWLREGRPVEDLPSSLRPCPFVPRYNAPLVRDFAHVLANIEGGREQLIDARPAARFRGEVAEPRPSPVLGHIPGAINLPFAELIDATTQTLLPAELLRARIVQAGIDPARPIVVGCGSGVTACVVALGLYRIGVTAAVYDGSWAEWSSREGAPVER